MPMSVIYLHFTAVDRLSWRDILVTPTQCAGNILRQPTVWPYAICRLRYARH